MKIAMNIVVVLIGLLATLGWFGLVINPVSVQDSFLLVPEGLGGLSNARSDIGALFLASALGCFLALRPQGRDFLWVPILLMGSAAVGRLISLAADGSSDTSIRGLIVEVIIMVVLGLIWRARGKASSD
ncbi:MAG: hypothetical protein ACJAYE_001627 [Candidatus Azotimanducaceae bacterium]|jgi:hypothetical protein